MTAGVFESAAPSGPDGEGQARGQARGARGKPTPLFDYTSAGI